MLTELTGDMDSSACSGRHELTNWRRLGLPKGDSLKRQSLKQSMTDGEYRAAAVSRKKMFY